MIYTNDSTKHYGDWVVQYRWIILLASLACLYLFVSGVKYLSLGSNYRVFFTESDPQLEAFDSLQKIYTKTDNGIIVIKPQSGDVITPNTLKAIQELTEKSWELPFASRVDSITNFQHIYADKDDLTVRDLVEDDPFSLSSEELEYVREVSLNEPSIIKRLISEDSSTAGINITFNFPNDNPKATAQIVSKVRPLLQEMRERYPDLDIRGSGIVFLNFAFKEATKNDMVELLPIMYGLMLLLMMLFLRSIFAMISITLVIGFSAASALGFGGWLGVVLTPPSAVVPTIVLTLSVANSIHITVSMFKAMQEGMDKYSAIAESLRINMQPVFITSITTMIGFLALNFSDTPPFHDLGNMAAFGMAIAFIYSITFLPALLSILPLSTKRFKSGSAKKNGKLIVGVANFVINNNKKILVFSIVFTILMTVLATKIELNDEFVKYFDHSVQFRKDTDFMVKNLTGVYNIEYSIGSDGPGGISNVNYLKKLDEYAAWLRVQPEVLHVYSISDTMKRLNKAMHEDKLEWYKIPDNNEMAAQYLLLYEMSLPYGLDLNDRINIDKSATRLTAVIKNISTSNIRELKTRSEQWLQINAPIYMHSKATSPIVMFAYIADRNAKSMLTGNVVALLLVSLCLWLALRSFKMGLFSLIPNLVPIVIGYGIWGGMIGQINMAASIAAAVCLGIVVDDTVHFLSKYLRARREHNASTEEAIRYAFSTVGTAMFFTTVILVFGFGTLATSSFQMNGYMGLLTLFVIISALIADFFLLPALLMRLDKKNELIDSNSDESINLMEPGYVTKN